MPAGELTKGPGPLAQPAPLPAPPRAPVAAAGPAYHGTDAVLLLHLVLQLLEAGLHPLVERPQRLCDSLPVDPDPFGQERNLQDTDQAS